MAKTQRLGRNSTMVAVQAAGVTDSVPVPEGVVLRDESEMVIWRQFTKVRQPSDWRDFDLVLVAKMVRCEADIRHAQAMLSQSGPLVKTDRGTPIANPLIGIIDTYQRQQLAVVRSLSMTQTEVDPRTKNAAGLHLVKTNERMDALNDLILRAE